MVKRFCALLVQDSCSNAYRAALAAGYTRRMAKSKSYRLARRAWRNPGFRSRWRALHVTPWRKSIAKREAESEAKRDAALVALLRKRMGQELRGFHAMSKFLVSETNGTTIAGEAAFSCQL